MARAGRSARQKVAAVLALTGLLAACAPRGEGGLQADSLAGRFVRGTAAEPTSLPSLEETRPIDCPAVRIQPGTETIRRSAGEDSADTLRWQATITRTSRSCAVVGERTAVRVGVAGRVLEGPSGAPAAVELPLRVAVREGEEVVYSRLHRVRVSRTGASQSWAFVDEDVTVSDARGARIVVGFDE